MERRISRYSLLFVSSVLVSLCVVALPTLRAQEEKGKAESESVSVTGCVQKGVEPGGFYITEGDKMYELSSRSVKLDEHVGHQVTVTGAKVKKSEDDESKSAENEKNESSGKDLVDLNVKSLKMVSETCGGK